MRLTFLALLTTLAACNTPSREFEGLVAQRVTIDGSTFDVRVRGELAEAIRLNMEYAPRFGAIETRAVRAMEVVSGCSVKQVTGDQAQALGQLDCDGTGGLYRPPPPIALECERISDPLRLEGNPRYADYDCSQF